MEIKMQQQNLFNNYKYCEKCNRPLPLSYESTLCPDCINHELFAQVKDYIRTNDVTEYDVAEHFHIPHHRVKQWIREGRIEYKDERLNTIKTLYCKRCGAAISFGTLCSKCQKKDSFSGHSLSRSKEDDSHMRFITKF